MGDAWQIKDQSQIYFFTFQVVGWADIFTRKCYRDIIIDSFSYCRVNKGMLLYSYVIMSNHVHAIIQSKNGNLSDLIRDFKRFSSSKIMSTLLKNGKESRKDWLLMIFKYHARYNKRSNLHQFWTHENHAVELSNENMFHSRMDYIHLNPVRSGLVESEFDYLYSSARNYSERFHLMEVDKY